MLEPEMLLMLLVVVVIMFLGCFILPLRILRKSFSLEPLTVIIKKIIKLEY